MSIIEINFELFNITNIFGVQISVLYGLEYIYQFRYFGNGYSIIIINRVNTLYRK